MNLKSASLERLEGHAFLKIVTDQGTVYIDSPKQLFLEWSFVPLTGEDVDSGKVETETSLIPPDPVDGRWTPVAIEHTTTDAVVLFLAKRLAEDDLPDGPLELPTSEMAGE